MQSKSSGLAGSSTAVGLEVAAGWVARLTAEVGGVTVTVFGTATAAGGVIVTAGRVTVAADFVTVTGAGAVTVLVSCAA